MDTSNLFKSARLKIDRASEHIAHINKVLSEERPFKYILETDARAGRRSTLAERNDAVIDRLSLLCGDAVQNLRDALDHAYSDVVSPAALSPQDKRRVQFPFSETAARLEEACRSRLAHKISPEFLAAIIGLKPHGEAGGNTLLYFLNAINNPGKHSSLVPLGYRVTIRVGEIRRQIPDFFPGMSEDSNFSCGQNGRDVTWHINPFSLNDWVFNRVPSSGMMKQEINIPVQITFEGRTDGNLMLTVPTLDQFVDVTKQAVKIISGFA